MKKQKKLLEDSQLLVFLGGGGWLTYFLLEFQKHLDPDRFFPFISAKISVSRSVISNRLSKNKYRYRLDFQKRQERNEGTDTCSFCSCTTKKYRFSEITFSLKIPEKYQIADFDPKKLNVSRETSKKPYT